MPTEISGVEEPPTDFTDAHRWLGCVGFSYGIHRIHSKLGCVRGALGTAWVRQDAIPSYICVNLCYLWESTTWFVGAAETAAPPEIASVGGNFKNVGAWVWQDAIPTMTLRLAVLGDSLLDEHFELLAEFGVVLQQSLCSVATLRQFRAVVAVPRARLLDDAVLYAEVYHLANL